MLRAVNGPSGERIVNLALVLISLAAAGALLVATPFGLGVTEDSYAYLAGAAHLQDGQGFFYDQLCSGAVLPITHYPPLYSAVLSSFGPLGVAPLAAARWLNAALLAGNSLAVGLVLRHLLPGARWVALLGAFLSATSLVMLEVHSAVWTEPLFIFLSLLGLICLGKHLAAANMRLLILAALLVGLAACTRYVGGSLVVAGGLALLVLSHQSFTRRLVDGALFGLVSCLPIGLVVLRNIQLSGGATNRQLAFHPAGGEHLEALITSLGSWLLPGTDRVALLPFQELITAGVVAVLLAFLVTGCVILLTSRTRPGLAPLIKLFLLYSVIYVALLFVSISLVDGWSPVDNRMLSPIFQPVLIVALCGAWAIYHRSEGRWVRRLLIVAGLGVSAAYLAADGIALNHLRQNGRGYYGPQWDYPALWASLRAQPREAPVYTNYPVPVTLHTGRRACKLFWLFGGDEAALAAAVERLGAGQADLVIFESARQFAPRQPGALGQKLASQSKIDDLLARSGVGLIGRERNAAHYGRPDGRPLE